MEANEVQELHEQHEHAREGGEGEGRSGGLKSISFTMSLLAVLVAVITVLGHRTHTEAVLMQARASDQWNLYQAKKIRQNETQLAADLLSSLAPKGGTGNSAGASAMVSIYKAHLTKWNSDLEQEQERARQFEEGVDRAERKARSFDLSEALLEIGLVITSITLLTRQRAYWFLGLVFGLGGMAVAAQGLLLH